MADEKVLDFDYSQLEQSHSTLVEEVIKLAKERNLNDFANELSVLFEVKEIPEFDLKKSPFIKYAERVNMNFVKQGFVKSAKADDLRHPIVAFCDDIRKFDTLLALAIKENTKN